MNGNLASRRLVAELRDIERNPIEGIAVRVSENDLMTYHVNMVALDGPYAGQAVHMHVTFTSEYPKVPPSVDIKTRIVGHPNLFYGFDGYSNAYVCLDMLKDPGYYAGPYAGWSPAYSLSGVLRQLYGFLLVDEQIEQENGEAVARSERKCRVEQVPCTCGFTHLPPPAIQPRDQRVPNGPPETPLPDLPRDVISLVLDRADETTVATCAAAGGLLGKEAMDSLRKEEERCFYTRDGLDDPSSPGTILGYGVQVHRHRDGAVNTLSMRMSMLSYAAFKDHAVRKSAWNEPFDAFLPLVINGRHGERAVRTFLDVSVPDMLGRRTAPCAAAAGSMRDPNDVLGVLSKIMNSLVIEVTDTDQRRGQSSPATAGGLVRHMSDAAVLGFCQLHHLLVTLATTRSLQNSLVQRARADVESFVRSADGRHKRRCPDLGMLLIKLMLVPKDVVPWATFAPLFLRELLSRHVRYAAQGTRDFADLGRQDESDARRLKEHFDSAVMSLRIISTEVWFANALARPKTAATAPEELLRIKQAYDACGGRPPEATFAAFNKHARGVLTIRTWSDVLSRMHFLVRAVPPTVEALKATFANVLRQAVVDSIVANYNDAQATYNKASVKTVYEKWDPASMPVVVEDRPWL
jgi:ubiquitin-protein ligase